MAQHDYNLANQSGADFRADLNNALSAIATTNSGATSPSTTFAHQLWVDTANSVLKIRNSANDAWITTGVSITADNTFDINGGTVNGITSFSFSTGSTVTSILDEDDLSSDSATALATQQSIKAYVDSQVGSVDTLAEILLNGNTTGGTDISLSSSDITGTGNINITGTVTSDGLTVDGDATIGADSSVYDLTLSSSAPAIRFSDTSFSATHFLYSNNGEFKIMGDAVVSLSTNNARRLRVESNGDIAFMDDTGSTQGLFWDASAERLGIGTTSPSRALHVNSSSIDAGIRVESTDANTFIEFKDSTTTTIPQIGGKADDLVFRNNDTESMRITSGGSVGIGTTSPSEKLTIDAGNIALIDNRYITWGSNTGRVKISGNESLDDIRFVTDNSERMRLTNTGLGIGTTSPSNPLTVLGADSIAIDDYIIHQGDSNTKIGFPSNDKFKIRVAGSDIATVTSTGLGIGTTSPSAKLDVDGGSGTVASFKRDAGVNGQLDLSFPSQIATLNTSTSLAFQTSATEKMRLTSTGLGIGTSSPSEKLHVVGGAATVKIESSTNVASLAYDNSTTTGAIELANNDLYTVLGGSVVMRILANGDVGIGTTSPNTKLEVNGSIELSEVDDALRFANSAIGIYRSSGNLLNISGYSGVVFRASAANYNSQTEVGRFDSSGHLLVGTTSTSPSLSNVKGIALRNEGHIYASRDGGVVGYFNRKTNDGTILDFRKDGSTVGSISTSSGTTSYNTTSDARLKDVTGEARGLEVITKLNPVAYNWKADGKADEGLIAQEVKEIVPNAVSGSEDEHYQMDYSKLVTPLVKAVQELEQQVTKLKSQIANLKGE